MGIFTRFRDIVSANINAMLDRAEDPEKLIRLMIREMEDTLVELKAACAGVMADYRKVERQFSRINEHEQHWTHRAQLAVDKGRDDLAREALVEKRCYTRRKANLEDELQQLGLLEDQYKDDIRVLEDKLKGARQKQRLLIQRHLHARRKKQAQMEIRRADSSEAVRKFDALENRIERMEAEADLVNFGKSSDLDEALDKLAADDDIERELQSLKKQA
jgi:phage shock protein A